MIPLYFAHGAGAGPTDPPLPALRARLGAGYAVTTPDLGPPDPEIWTRRIKSDLAALPDGTLLVGHSLGASHLLKCLAELGPAVRPRALVGLAAPLWGMPGWEADGFALPAWAPEPLAHLPLRMFQSRDDEAVAFDHLAAWGRLFPHARLYPLDGQTHVFTGDLSAIAIAISEL